MKRWRGKADPPTKKQTNNKSIDLGKELRRQKKKKKKRWGGGRGQCLKLDYHPPVDRSDTQGSGQQGWCELGMVTMLTLSGNWIPAQTCLIILNSYSTYCQLCRSKYNACTVNYLLVFSTLRPKNKQKTRKKCLFTPSVPPVSFTSFIATKVWFEKYLIPS